MWIEETFPLITQTGYSITSGPTEEYNCVAWAANSKTAWWSHLEGYYWPVTRTPDIQSLVAVFASLGYEVCDNISVEDAYDKVALYAVDGQWTHAARQLPDGRWTSKLGLDEDIEHTTPEALCSSHYGVVHCIMRRQHRA